MKRTVSSCHEYIKAPFREKAGLFPTFQRKERGFRKMEEKEKPGILWVREELKKNTDQAYREFHSSLIPGIGRILGVRVPKLRELSKKAARETYWETSKELDLSLYEELMIRGMLIGYGKLTREEQKKELEDFVPHIDNWAVCDCCCSTYKFMKKDQEEWFRFLETYARGDREYEIRFALVCMMDFFIKEEFLDRMFRIFSQIRHEGYYVKMGMAWALSVCYVKFPKETESFLRQNTLDAFTHNKTIQKIRESLRVSKEDKERLKEWIRREK